jgi:hypothetical protein
MNEKAKGLLFSKTQEREETFLRKAARAKKKKEAA